jgi:glycosyltransferase involved in cell wall biosynthesis
MSVKKIKILQTIRQGKIGGGESHVLDLVQELNKDRYESIVLSFTKGPMIQRMEELGIKTYVIETEKPFDKSKRQAVSDILVAENIDIVHAHGTRANSNTYYSAKNSSIPIVYTVHGWSFHKGQNFLIKNLRILSERFLVNKATITLCVSNSNLEEGRNLFNIKNARVIKNGINQHRFNPDGTYKDLRAELNIQGDEILVGYIVRVTLQKDPLTLIKAISLIDRSLKIKFLFVGEGDLLEDTKKLAAELNVNSKIIFLNFRQDVPNVLNAIDIYCLPSLWEGLPIGVLEAMAMRKAIIATAIDATKEIITSQQNGILVPVKSPQLLADALTLLANDASLRQTLGVNAAKTIADNFNVQKMTRQIEAVYDQIIKSSVK